MQPNEEVIVRFYTAFQRRDADGMCACYHADLAFSDPAFGSLTAQQAKAMWRMLCGRSADLKITFGQVQADDMHGSAHWEADYLFSKARRQVHNSIDAHFIFKDGLIVRHDDRFDLARWAGMALGPVGALFGWTPFLQASIRKDARRRLDIYMAGNA